MSKQFFARAVALIALISTSAAQAALIQNGSFELKPSELSKFYQHSGFKYDARTYDQLAASDKWGIYATLPGWNSLFGDQIELAISGVKYDVNGQTVGFNAQDGNNFVELDTHFNVVNGKISNQSNAGISQNLTGLTVGQTYELSFWYHSRTTAQNDNTMDVFWLPTDSLPNYPDYVVSKVDTTAANHTDWQQYTVRLVAKSPNMTIGFGASGDKSWSWNGLTSTNGNKTGANLDNVSLIAVSAPTTALLFGFGVAGLMLRRRKA